MSGILYLHGFASGPASKKAQYFARRFAAHDVQLQIPDLAAGNFSQLTITGQLRVIEQAAGGQPVTLIGSSLGGYLAALYASRHAETQRVVLLAPGFAFPLRWPEALGAERMAEWRRTGYLSVYHYGEKKEARLGYQLVEDAALYEDYPPVAQPCLIFHGKDDDVVPIARSIEFAKGKANVELHVEDSDHELLNVLEPMWQRIRQFVLD